MIHYQQCDFMQAAAYFRLAGDDNPVALFNLGCLVQKGFAERNAMELFAQASSKGHLGAQNNFAILLAQTEPERAKALLEEAAKNCAQAANNLGVLLERTDPAGTAKAFKEAADAGLPEAMETYADMVEQEKGVEEDRDTALEYYMMAVDASGGRLTASVITLKRLQGQKVVLSSSPSVRALIRTPPGESDTPISQSQLPMVGEFDHLFPHSHCQNPPNCTTIILANTFDAKRVPPGPF
jgi:hypothetical protein